VMVVAGAGEEKVSQIRTHENRLAL
jgi:hypothetical protein